MTTGERLVFLSGLGPASAATHLLAISLAGSAAGDRLVSRSGLATGTAAQHLMDDGTSPPDPGAPGFSVGGNSVQDLFRVVGVSELHDVRRRTH